MRKSVKTIKFCKLTDEDGFTLVELITVVVIIGVMVAIAVAIYSDISRKPANEAHNANQRTLVSAMHMAFTSHGTEWFNGVDGTKELVWEESNRETGVFGGKSPGWGSFLAEWPEVPKESSAYIENVEYKVYLESPGPKVIVEP